MSPWNCASSESILSVPDKRQVWKTGGTIADKKINVLIEKHAQSQSAYCKSNIDYAESDLAMLGEGPAINA